MYIIAIGWIWVVFMMAITEHNIVAGLMTFVFYGMLPCALLLYLMGTPGRRRRRALEEALRRETAGTDPGIDAENGNPDKPGQGGA